MNNSIKKKELIRFLVGGGTAVITDYLVYKVLLYIGLNMSISKGTSFICGSIVGFVINKLWTFESKNFIKSEVIKYVILYTITAYINAKINSITIVITKIHILGFLCATGVSTILNFLGQKFFVFKGKGE